MENPSAAQGAGRAASPTPPPNEELRSDQDTGAETKRSPETRPKRTSKFRFKSKHSGSQRSSRHRDGRDGRDAAADDHGDNHDEDSSQRRYHRHRRRRRDPDDPDREGDGDHEDEKHRRKRRRRHHHHDHRSRSRSPTPPNPYEPPPLSPDAAFRASLFDAMADDEGAAYWEAVYGQPMHVYAQPTPAAGDNDASAGAGAGAGTGELERMDDEEYASYVRQKMWEKTHEGLLEERARREAARHRRDDERREARHLARDVEASLRRGEQRRLRRAWRDRWDAYVAAWARWEEGAVADGGGGGGGADGEQSEQQRRRHLLEHDAHPAWPVESGRRADVRGSGPDNNGNDKNTDRTNIHEDGTVTSTTTAVREFFVRGLDAAREGDGDGDGQDNKPSTSASASALDHPDASVLLLLKEERVRWHPDKVQQRLGGRVDEVLMRDVTAVFQVVDALWADARAKVQAK